MTPSLHPPFVGLFGIPTDADATAVFHGMDGDGQGMVLLSELCSDLRTKEMESKITLGNLLYGNVACVYQPNSSSLDTMG